MYVTILGALLVIMSLFVLVPCYVNKAVFNKVFPYFLFLICWYLIYAISMLFELPYFILVSAIIAAGIAYGFDYLRKSKKVAIINRYFAE